MKKALIVANLAGFGNFLLSDMDILHEYGYEVYFAANASNHEWEDTRNELEKRNVDFSILILIRKILLPNRTIALINKSVKF